MSSRRFKKKIRSFSNEIVPEGEQEAVDCIGVCIIAESGEKITTEAGDEITTES
jgi:hypothetical protein